MVSQKPTPVTVAVPRSRVNDDVPGLPHAVTNALRALVIAVLLAELEAPEQCAGSGNSTIIVRPLYRSATTKW
jgi:hypothetical protein